MNQPNSVGLRRNPIVALAVASAMFLAGCGMNPHQSPGALRPIGTSLNAWDEDIARKAELESLGACRLGRDVVAWFPCTDSSGAPALSDAEMSAIVAKLERGIRAAKSFIGAPDWSCGDDRRVFFYFPDANFISHAPGDNTAFIPLWRIRQDQAPWIHEAMHLLVKVDGDWLSQADSVAEARMPLWLHEGLAEALAMAVAQQEGFAHYSPLIDVPADRLDAFAAQQIRACPDPSRLLAFVGGRGKLPELFGEERMKYAPAFYAASTSLVRSLARRDGGYRLLLRAVADFDNEITTYERLSGRSLDESRREWMGSIGVEIAPSSVSPSR